MPSLCKAVQDETPLILTDTYTYLTTLPYSNMDPRGKDRTKL